MPNRKDDIMDGAKADIREQIAGVVSNLREAMSSIVFGIHFFVSLELWRIVLTLVSAVTTWYGLTLLYDAFGAGHGGSSLGWLGIIIPLAVAGALHAAIYWALGRWSGTRRHQYLFFAVPLQLLAISASFGTHWTHMQGGSVTTADYNRAQASVYQGLAGFVHSYRMLADQTHALSEHSDAEAAIEAKNGTSCSVEAGRGRGPRYRLRMADRDTYQTFNSEIASHMKRLEDLLNAAGGVTAVNADDAIQKMSELQRIVGRAQPFEDDPLLTSLRDTAQARIIEGEGPMKDSTGSRPGAQTFTCADPVLEQHLRAVIAAIGQLRPLPIPEVNDARDPHVGFVLALRRVFNSVWGLPLLPRTKAELQQERISVLHQNADATDGIQPGDISPLVMAVGIESLLTLLFWISRGSLPLHPGLDSLREYLDRPRNFVIQRLWARIQQRSGTANLHDVLHRHANFKKREVLIIFPLYSDNSEIVALHQLMELLCAVRLAKNYYTGRNLFGLFTTGLPDARKLELKTGAPMRVYRMRGSDYSAVLMDAVAATPADDPGPFRETDHGPGGIHIVRPEAPKRSAA